MTKNDASNNYLTIFFASIFLLILCCFFCPWIYHKLLKNCQKRTWRNRLTRRRRTASNSETGRNSSENGYELQALNQGEPSDSMWSYMNDNVSTKNETVNKYVETTNKYSETANKYAVDDIDFTAPFHVLRRSKSLNDLESVMYR